MPINKADYSAEVLETFVQQWLGTTEPVDVDNVDFTFLPDPKADNWVEAAIMAGQRGFAALHVQAVFGRAVPLLFSIGSGDVLCDQYTRSGRVRVLSIHDEPFAWTDGGAPSVDPPAADRFVHEWLDNPVLDQICERLGGSPDQDVEALDGDLRRAADGILATYRSICPIDGGHLPDIIGARPLNQAIQCLLPAGVRAKPKGLAGVLSDASWIAASLTRGVSLPDPAACAKLRASIDQMVDPSTFGPATSLRLLWSSYFLEARRSEMVEIARTSTWRVIVDSARLIEKLAVDPTLGARTLVTVSGLAKLEQDKAAAAAEAARRVQIAREERQARIDAGHIVLDVVEKLPSETYGLTLRRFHELPEPLKVPFRFAATDFNRLLAIGDRIWAGTTSTDRWLGVQRGPEPGFPFSYTLMTGRESVAPIDGLTGDNQFFHPGEWRADGDFAYCIANKVLREIDLEARTHRVLIAWNPAEAAVIKAEPVSYAVYPDGLCSIDRDERGTNLRLCGYAPGGALTTVASFALPCASVAYDAPSRTLLIVTVEHGTWFARVVDGAWRVLQRIAHVPKVGPFDTDRLTPTVDGLHLQARPSSYKIQNLDRERPEAGVLLVELCGDLDRLSELPPT